MKKKLLVVVGAGASIDFGMPKVDKVDELFEKWALEMMPLEEEPQKSLYTWVKEKYREYAEQNPSNRMGSIINFERILYLIQNLASIAYDRENNNYNHHLNPFITIGEFPRILRFRKSKVANGDDFRHLQLNLTDKLLKYFRDKCKTLKEDKPEQLEKFTKLHNDLSEHFEVGYVTFNYDNVILSAVPELVTGFNPDTNYFDRDIFYQGGWNFCYHLHGSVHFNMIGGRESTEMHKVAWEQDLNAKFRDNSFGRSGQISTEGLNHPTSSIIAGLDKTNQLTREPFASYYMQLDKLVHESDSILFLGYGFSDLHLNKIIPPIRHNSDSKIRKVAIIDWANEDEDGFSFRHDGWSFGVSSSLPVNGYEMGDGESRLNYSAQHYKSNNIFEISSNEKYPLAIWYNGLMPICDQTEMLLSHLL